jgi:soluble lytic murein transglycosylase
MNSLLSRSCFRRERLCGAAILIAVLLLTSSAARTQTETPLARLQRGYQRLQAKDYSGALALLADPGIARQTALGDYALYYHAQSLAGLGRSEEAEREYRRLAQTHSDSLLSRPALLAAGSAALARGDHQAVLTIVAPLVAGDDGSALKLRADALEALGRTDEAVAALRRIYFAAPQTEEAAAVSARLTALGGTTVPVSAADLRLRADRLYAAGQYVLAAQVYDQLARTYPSAPGEDASLRAGISYYRANSFAPALDALSRARTRTPRDQVEALYHTGLSQVALRREAAFVETLGQLRRAAPASERTADLIYSIARMYERTDRPGPAATYYEQLVRQFPRDDRADEAHFHLAWRAHEAEDYRTSSTLLLAHLADYSKTTDNRGKAAFWAAVDAERAGEKARALALYRALLHRYGAGWYGVNSERRIAALERAGIKPQAAAAGSPLARAIEGLQPITIAEEKLAEEGRRRVMKAEQLMRISLYGQAKEELETARADAPDSPLANLRIAQLWRAQGEYAASISVLRRAYPDYGQALPSEMPREVWEVFYPLGWWPTIKQESKRHGLDPHFVAGLIRQETIFNPQARSRANALGLMQLLPSTGRLVARKYSLGQISNADLYNPVLNIQLGTAYLADMVRQFGRNEYAAAAYNGGPTRVSRWLRELPTEEIEEWVDSIPISETRNYVQGVYRNMRQYQRLYDDQGRFKSGVPEK